MKDSNPEKKLGNKWGEPCDWPSLVTWGTLQAIAQEGEPRQSLADSLQRSNRAKSLGMRQLEFLIRVPEVKELRQR